MATTEDFTFPIFTNDPFSSGIDSPSLWHLSPAASPDHKTTIKQEQEQEQDSDQEEEFQDCFPLHKTNQRKSFSWVEKGSKDDKEEKMDMLWEDFNEEVSSSLNRRSHLAHQLRLTKTSSAMVSPKKPAAGFVVFIKVLKKLFLLHNSPHPHHHHHARISVQTHHSINRRAKNRSW